MKSIKNILKSSLYMLIFFIILTLIVTILNYFNIFNYKAMNIIKIIVPILSFCFGGFTIGKASNKNGWLEGLKQSSFVSLILAIITLLVKAFKLEYFIYLIILIVAGTFGSMLGINKKNT